MIRGYQVVAGAWGTLHWNGRAVLEVAEVNAEIEMQRADIQINIAVDSKMTGLKGSGTLKCKHVYTSAYNDMLEAYKQGLDVRHTLSIAISDPDATGGQRGRLNIGNVWFNKAGLAGFNVSEVVERELEFGFTPTDAMYQEMIG